MKRLSRKTTLLIPFFFLTTILTCCKEDYYDPYYKVPSPFAGVPDNFNWATISSATLRVNVNDEYNGEYYYTVEVFDENPVLNSGAKLLAKGVARKGDMYISEVNFPQTQGVIYVRQTSPNGLRIVQEHIIDSQEITVDFSGSQAATSVKSKSVATRSAAPAYQGNRNDAISINLNTSSVTLLAGKSYVITGGTYSGDIVFYGSWNGQKTTVFVEGEWNVPSRLTDFQNGLEIVVLSGGKVSFSSSSQTLNGYNGVNLFIMSGGLFNSDKKNININFTDTGGNIYNYGEFYLSQMKLNGGKFYNNSSLTNITSFTQTGTIENHGLLTIGNIDATSGFIIDNYCNIIVTGDISTSGGTFYLHNNTNLSCINFDLKGTTVNMEPFSLFDVTGTATFNSWSSTMNGTGTGTNYALARMKKVVCNGSKNITYSGNLELECSDHTANGKYNNVYYMISPAHMVSYGSPSVLIPASECTGKGSYPAGTKPTNPAFPIEVPTSSIYSYAIEDFWPAYGDYDMNDLVVESQSSYAVDNRNFVTSMTITARLMAVGATKKLGAAFQLDQVSAINVSSVTVESDSPNNRLNGTVFTVGANGTETEQTKAIIPLFDEAHHFLSDNASEKYYMLNTSAKGEDFPPKQVKITINFRSGTVSPTDITIKNLNYFVVTDAKKENRKEIHLPGYLPTSKAIKTYFGGGPNNIPSNNDLSLNGVYYRGTDNLIWGLMIPGSFNYPLEKSSILLAYPQFQIWATSGGTTNKDWYENQNANTTYIYKKSFKN